MTYHLDKIEDMPDLEFTVLGTSQVVEMPLLARDLIR